MLRFQRFFVAVAMLGLLTAGCTADVEDPGSLPDVDVEGGDMPNIDVDPAQVEVSTDTQTIQVPDVDVTPAPDND